MFSAAILAGGCASPPPRRSRGGFTAATKRAALTMVGQPIPACQPGHASALANGEVELKPGETICVRLKTVGNVVAPVEVVDKFDPADTLVVRLWNSPTGNETYLYLHNPLHLYLRYQADIRRPGSDQFRYTDTCPVLDRRIGFEQWPYVVDALVIRNLVTLPAGGSITCE